MLTNAFTDTPWNLLHNESVVLEKPARDMAQLHLANLHTWRRDDFAVRSFKKAEIDHLEEQLAAIASGTIKASSVHNTARQILAERA